MPERTWFLPVFESRTDPPARFVSVPCGWCYKDRGEAWESGWGLSFVEGILFGFKFTGEVLEIKEREDGTGEIPHRVTRLGRDQMIDVQVLVSDEELTQLGESP